MSKKITSKINIQEKLYFYLTAYTSLSWFTRSRS